MGPDIDYVRAHVDGEQLILAAELVEQVLGEGIETEPAGEIVGRSYEPPFPYVTDFGERSHTVLPADFVTTGDGTGIVHTALAFGEDDFALGERFGMTLQNPVKPTGRSTSASSPSPAAACAKRDRTSWRPCASPGGCCAPRTTSTPTRTAGAAARR